mmetsp:Transcript_3801/g.5902  ORF Transcript_3801/g.5902 Transcript_3801/m.5902 type:complete len:992 (-) Transcript_3801:88-3063(-)|eukprot:CAMPEP_0185030708 /NCGR_PEP_ID=MMETSP1103-20130426/17721_1 /TAXON_ID=36769 /ORGANISM="Paraphysomonas bandaiensis, Strain Caron Lab Isolate" /LENGTH=991 /DNA_ID=CAMNT_0027565931 /DNA_START=82 /DNA_END=3057 /DNA_ORIENTATION=-
MSIINNLIQSSENTEGLIRSLISSLILSGASKGSSKDDHTFPQFISSTEKLSEYMKTIIQQINERIQSCNAHVMDISTDLMDSSLYELIVDMIDMLVENADTQMGEDNEEIHKLSSLIKESLIVDRDRILRESTCDIPKPQLMFRKEIDNSRNRPFRPRLLTKPHSSTPLDIREMPVEASDAISVAPVTYYAHPYESEIKALCARISHEQQLADSAYINPVMPAIPAMRPFEYIDEPEELQSAVNEIKCYKEIAIALEHHSYRSFQGITCLMQISTREKDYIIDALALRKYMSSLLPIFTDPEVVKVFHGCDNAILWLQRDFGLYIVNCFDTYHAAKALRYPTLSLAHLLKYHCGITLNKRLQLSDWRQRRLPADMLEYARSNTHYLLYIYDCVRRDVHASQGAAGIEAVLIASQRTCLKRYEKEPFSPLGYSRLLVDPRQGSKQLKPDITAEQNAALAALWNWRDLAARREDESPLFIMSNAELVRLGQAVPLDEAGILACAPLSSYLRDHIPEVVTAQREQLGLGPADAMSSPSSSSAPVIRSRTLTDSSDASMDEVYEDKEGTAQVIRPKWSPCDATQSKHGQVRRTVGDTSPSVMIPIAAEGRTVASPGAALYLASSSAPSASGRPGETVTSPDPGADPEWPQLFNDAMWRATTAASPMHPGDSPIDAVLRTMSPTGVGAATIARLEKAHQELQRSSAITSESEGSHFSPVASVSASNPDSEPGSGAVSTASSLDALPQSLTEIYDISNRNRGRNKDKKRNRDVPESQEKHVQGQGQGQKDQDTEWYETSTEYEEKGADGTLDFAISVGWVEGADKNRVMEKHLADEHANSTAQQGEEGTHAGRGRPPSADRRSASNEGTHRKRGNSKGSTGSRSSSAGSHKTRSNSGDRSKVASSFDYSRAHHGAPHGALGGHTTPSMQLPKQLSASAPAAFGAAQQGGKYHQFIAGPGASQAGSAPARGNKKSGPGGRGAIVERRDRERSRMFPK